MTVKTLEHVVLQSLLCLEGELKVVQTWFNQGPKVYQDQSLGGLHQVGSQCNWSVVVGGNVADTMGVAATLEVHFVCSFVSFFQTLGMAYQKRNRYHVKTDGTTSE